MPTSRKSLPPYLQRSLLALIIVLMGVSIGRLLVTMHRQGQRIEVLEAQVQQLLSDTTRLRIPAYSYHRSAASGIPVASQGDIRTTPHHRSEKPSPSRSSAVIRTDSSATMADSTITGADISRPTSAYASSTPAPRKFTESRLFDLNTIDSLTLIRIPGIASRTASVILKYRQRYGGFYDPHQLGEFLTWDAAQDYLDEWCTRWFTADASRLRTLHLNAASVSELQHHPYISHEQAVEIVRYRTRHQRISSVTELQQLTTFSAAQLQAVLPYLVFD